MQNLPQIKAKANKSDRTFTLRKYDYDSNLIAKYRTHKQSKEDFQSLSNNTENDWRYFLRSTEEYYLVK